MNKINHNLPSKPSPGSCKLNRLRSSKMVTSDRFCQCNYCLGQETGSWYFLLHLLRIFLQATGFCTWKKPCGISIGGQNKQDRKLYVQYTDIYIKQLQQKLNTEKNGKKINQMCKCSSHLWQVVLSKISFYFTFLYFPYFLC